MDKAPASERLSFTLLALALFGLYLVTHPWRGVHGDALIYVTRAFAPPAVLDGDMLFTHERQTGLTLYGVLLGLLSHVAPVADAARGLAFCGAAVWFSGLLALTRAMTRAAHLPPQMALAMAALVALAPLSYSAGSSFLAGEVLAVPRPFAEGFVLLAFARLLQKRWRTGVFALAVAMLFHPLMGLAGAAVAFTWAALGDRRLWLVACLLVALALAVAAVADRLAPFDADWLALLRLRTSYLFLSQAPASFWVDLLLRGVILFIAARLCFSRLRALLQAVLIASALAILVSLLFADLWPSMLITQAQPWRVLFIPAILAPAAVVLIAFKGEGPSARVTLALVACALMTRDVPALSVLFSLGALAFHAYAPLARKASSRMEAALWIVATAAWVGFDLINLVALGHIIADAPPDLALPWSYLWVLRPLALPLSVLAIVLAGRGRLPQPWMAGLLCVLCAGAAWLRFDDRAPVDVSLEAGVAPDLVAALPPGDGAVLWLSLGKEPWYWLNRPNWVAPVQASSIVFSRDLARDWSERTRFLIEQGIYAPGVIANQAAPSSVDLAREKIRAVCGRKDSPSAIVAPLRASESILEGARRVVAPAPSFVLQSDGGLRFEKIASYAVWTCAPSPN